MCKPTIHPQAFQSKTSLIQELGDENQMSFLLMNFCNSIKEDADFQMLFNHMSMNRFSTVMCSLTNSA